MRDGSWACRQGWQRPVVHLATSNHEMAEHDVNDPTAFEGSGGPALSRATAQLQAAVPRTLCLCRPPQPSPLAPSRTRPLLPQLVPKVSRRSTAHRSHRMQRCCAACTWHSPFLKSANCPGYLRLGPHDQYRVLIGSRADAGTHHFSLPKFSVLVRSPQPI